jgi:hypothetical protein
MTQSKKLAWLNGLKAYAEGSSDMTGMGATIKVYAMKEKAKAAASM